MNCISFNTVYIRIWHKGSRLSLAFSLRCVALKLFQCFISHLTTPETNRKLCKATEKENDQRAPLKNRLKTCGQLIILTTPGTETGRDK